MDVDHPTRLATLHRLAGVPSVDAVAGLLKPDVRGPGDEGDVDGERLTIGGVPAVWFWVQRADETPTWLTDVERTLGRSVPRLVDRRSGVLVALEVDGAVFTVTYGSAWRWIPEEHHDPLFGLRVVVRCLDPTAVRTMMSRRFGMGRTDRTDVPDGAPIWAVRPQDYLDVVRRLAGKAADLELTSSLTRTTKARDRRQLLEGAAGLRLRLGVRGDDLVRDIRHVVAIERRPALPELAFVENIRPAPAADAARLDADLDAALAEPGAVTLAVPDQAVPYLSEQDAVGLVRGTREERADDVGVERILELADHRLSALRRARVRLYARDEPHPVVDLPAIRWVETVRTLDDEAYYLVEGRWFDVDPRYARQVRDEVRRAFDAGARRRLPVWRTEGGRAVAEGVYNLEAAADAGMLCLDRQLVSAGLHTGNGIEVCDLLTADGAYVHVKRAKGSAALSHLFAQGLNATLALRNQTEVRQRFREVVAGLDPSWPLPPDLVPRRLVFAILREAGPLTPETLYPMSAASLAQVMRQLDGLGVTVEVVPIPLDTRRTTRAA